MIKKRYLFLLILVGLFVISSVSAGLYDNPTKDIDVNDYKKQCKEIKYDDLDNSKLKGTDIKINGTIKAATETGFFLYPDIHGSQYITVFGDGSNGVNYLEWDNKNVTFYGRILETGHSPVMVVGTVEEI